MTKNSQQRLLTLTARKLDIDTHQELTIYLHQDSYVCHSEGFSALSRVRVNSDDHSIIATLHIVRGSQLTPYEIGFSDSAWQHMQLTDGDQVWVSHPKPLESLSYLRAKVFGHKLNEDQIRTIVNDVVAGRYADVHLAAFITACGDRKLDTDEIIALTRAMVDSGSRLNWQRDIIVDKHCVGGLPGNRTTPIVVSILASLGLTMPKTSSRAITSPAGTADTMETLTEVSLSLSQMQEVVRQHGGCLAWGGSVQLSPADDLLIRVERALDIDSEGQLIASVLSKKIAAGATHVLIDIPVGPTAKVRDQQSAKRLAEQLRTVAQALGLQLRVLFSDGSQPVGRGIGPALEALDILAVLENSPQAPQDLKERAILLAGELLEMSEAAAAGKGQQQARQALEQGHAWQCFQAICQAQGGLRQPPVANYRYNLLADCAGRVAAIDNRLLSQAAKLAGAPVDKAAGIVIYKHLGDSVKSGETLLTLHAESPGELDYAVEFLNAHPELIQLQPDPIP
ncbi:thymidine phosphorylase family protein [Motiliproteus coralliicola]|uniref:Putative thymidine phosphorylase n=1 Tax=Motiliproteus coralliicola TaxID=2283196 RepID=A0A369WQ36_9GAMM|nr:thymidine phosphorylase family protein [Motiliproteus coralliicola]RDE24190.1 thymidine phosphorylase family protein [Motiliproteus coralliicola]